MNKKKLIKILNNHKNKIVLANEDGFTLLESLVVLMIASLFLLIPILSLQQATERVQIELFFRDLTSQITLMQNHAMLAGQPTKITFIPARDTISFRVMDLENIEVDDHPINRDIN